MRCPCWVAKATHTHTHIHTLSHTYTHSHTHSLTHWHIYTHSHNTLTHSHAHTYTHTHTHSLTHIHTHIYTHAHTLTRIHTHTHSHTHIHTLTLTHIHSHTFTLTLTHTHTHIHTHSLTHTYTHTLTHTHTTLSHTHTHSLTLTHTYTLTQTHSHSQYVTLIAFPLQQCLRGRASNLRYTYIARLVILHLILLSLTLLQTCVLLSSIPHFLSSSICFLAYIYLPFRLTIIFLLNFLQLRPVGHAPGARQQDVLVWKMDLRYRWEYNIKMLALPWLRQLVASLSSRKPGFKPGQVHVDFLADWVAVGPVSLGVLPFSSVSCIPEMLHWLCVHISPLLCIFCNWQLHAIT